jgi:hypothetical protein
VAGELRHDTVWRLDICAGALLDGSISHADLAEDWHDWYHLAPAFVAAYAPEDLAELEAKATFLAQEAAEVGNHDPLSDDDRRYLEALRAHLDLYPEVRHIED